VRKAATVITPGKFVKLSLTAKVVAGFTAAFMILGLIAAVSFESVRSLTEMVDWEVHAHEALAELRELRGQVSSSESGQRSYVLTGERRFLETYHAAAPAIQECFAKVRRLTFDNPSQQARLDRVQALINERIAWSETTITLRDREGFDAALKAILTATGLRLSEDIAAGIAEMEQEERRFLLAREEQAHDWAFRTNLVVLLGSAIALAVVVVSCIVITREIRERSRAEAALAEARDELELRVAQRTAELTRANVEFQSEVSERNRAEQRFRLAVESAPNGVLMMDQNGRILMVNREVDRAFGYRREELLELSVEALLPHRFRARHPEYRQEFIAHPEARPMGAGRDLYGLRKDGSEFPNEIGLNPIQTDQQLFVLATVVDITERKRAEQKIRSHSRLLELILQNMGDGVILADKQGKIWFLNPVARRLLGLAADAPIPSDWTAVKGRYLANGVSPYPADRLWLGRAVRGESVDDELLFIRHEALPEGAWISGTARPIIEEDGSSMGGVVVWHDITRQKKAEEALNKLNAELEQRVADRTAQLEAANRELETFSYSVSHDLRAPLRAIDGFSQALLEDYADGLDANGKRYLERVRAATQRMGRLIDDLLELSRVTRPELRRARVELGEMAESIVAELARTDPQRKVELKRANGVAVNADPRLLEIVLDNLLGNAWKFTRDQPRAVIEMGVAEDDGEPAYYVRDNGAGFDMAYAGKLFGAFQRLHPSTEYEGTGIGLATVQRIVHRHGGRVWAEAKVDKGATFYFTLGERVE
jgi:PAS domain S-box-containing protein